MSLKAVELQIAIPKTFDAGKIADNHQQNVINQQLHANEALKKEIERKQTSVQESEHLEHINEKDEGTDPEQNAKKHKKSLMKEKQAKHPFKGNLFDFSG